MKKTSLFLAALFFITSSHLFATSRLQVIHNSADQAAATVDVWLNNTLLLDNFAFRTASPVITAPSDVSFKISIQPSNSTDTVNALFTKNYTLQNGKTYVVIANGIVSASGYSPATPFDLYAYDMGEEAAGSSANTDVMVFHGATDAPVVDVKEVGIGAGTIVDNLAYGSFSGYLALPTADYSIQIRDEHGISTVAQYDAPLATLGLNGAAAVAVASGFLNPANNSNGPAFGIYVALPSGGDLVALPAALISTARVQVIHNSADAAAATVDVWLNTVKLIDNFQFRTATPFIDAPAGENITIAIKDQNSTSPDNPIASFTYNLTGGETYVLVANGIVSATGYNPSPAFNLDVYAGARERAIETANTDVMVYHGSTDAPTVDVKEVGVGAGTIVNDISYSAFSGYLALPTADYSIQIRDAAGITTAAQYDAPLATLGLNGTAAVALASGFLNPAVNSDGPAFGIYVALPSGGALVPLPAATISTARVQVIHNAADAAAAMVDVWLNSTKLIDNFQFRSATPFVDAPAGENITIAIKDQNSTNPDNPIASFNYNLTGGATYLLIANGIVSATGYNPAPAFNLDVFALGRERALVAGNTDVLVYHGSTDAPTVDVVETGVGAGTIVDNLAYNQFAGYLELPAVDYKVDVRDETGTTTVATYDVPLATLGLQDAALTVLASGFLNPANNSNGPAFGLYVALAAGGTLVPLPLATGIDNLASNISDVTAYPNPASDMVKVQYNLATASDVRLEVFNILGSKLIVKNLGSKAAGSYNELIALNNFPSGLYISKIIANGDEQAARIVVSR